MRTGVDLVRFDDDLRPGFIRDLEAGYRADLGSGE